MELGGKIKGQDPNLNIRVEAFFRVEGGRGEMRGKEVSGLAQKGEIRKSYTQP